MYQEGKKYAGKQSTKKLKRNEDVKSPGAGPKGLKMNVRGGYVV